MGSTQTINFSLRQNKALERALVFEALQRVSYLFDSDPTYIGLGSVWFQDFHLAHQLLGIERMISIEANQQIHRRAEFNRPYATVEIKRGHTRSVLPKLLKRKDIKRNSCHLWLDYDSALDIDTLEELLRVISLLPEVSTLLVTLNSEPTSYASNVQDRREAMFTLFGREYTGELPDERLRGSGFMATLADCLLAKLKGQGVATGRSGGFIPGFRLLYKDTSRMITIGGFLPRAHQRKELESLISIATWSGTRPEVIDTPPLTIREIQTLSQLMPSPGPLSMADVRKVGLGLDLEQVEAFRRNYLRYPVYAEIR